MTTTTRHAKLRARKRIGTSDVDAAFADALAGGVHQADLKGRLRKFIDSSARNHRKSAVIYRGIVYWYEPTTKTLITVIPLHQKWHKYLR